MLSKKIGGWVKDHGVWVLLLFLLVIAVNYHTEILGLYQDDLYLWTRFANHHALDYIFQTGTSRFRPVWEFLAYLELKLTGTHTELLVPVNMAVNGCIAGLVYGMGYYFSRKKAVAFLTGITFVLSRFSYYQIGMVLGLMESAAMIQALCLLFCLYRYLNTDKRGTGYGAGALVLYFTLVFTHERYMVLVLLLLPVFFFKKNIKLAGGTAAAFGLVQLIRWWAIGTVLPPGAGPTAVADTFQLSQALYYAVTQVLYIFGINCGPDYLNGKPWQYSPSLIRLLVILSIALLLLACLLFVMVLVKNKKLRGRHIQNTILFLAFIALCIGASSVTIRVEMRWVYVSYAAALIFLNYIYGAVARAFINSVERQKSKSALRLPFVCFLLILCYTAVMLPVESYYRGERKNLYYWSNQRRANTLYEITYGKYGEEFFGKQVYLLENTFELDDYTLKNFFRVYSKDKEPGVPVIQVVTTMDDFGLVDENTLVLAEDKKHNTYLDVTEFVKEEKLKRISGCYEDGWLDQSSEFIVKAGSTGKITMNFYYPGNLKGGEEIVIFKDGKEIVRVAMDAQSELYELDAEPFEKIHLKAECNFTLESPPEKRGEKDLSVVLEMIAP